MIAIKDMEMTKCCHWDCPLCLEDGGACILGAYDPKTDTKKERASDCPLVEIITCENCDNRCTGGLCTKHNITVTKDFFCGDGERRE